MNKKVGSEGLRCSWILVINHFDMALRSHCHTLDDLALDSVWRHH